MKKWTSHDAVVTDTTLSQQGAHQPVFRDNNTQHVCIIWAEKSQTSKIWALKSYTEKSLYSTTFPIQSIHCMMYTLTFRCKNMQYLYMYTELQEFIRCIIVQFTNSFLRTNKSKLGWVTLELNCVATKHFRSMQDNRFLLRRLVPTTLVKWISVY